MPSATATAVERAPSVEDERVAVWVEWNAALGFDKIAQRWNAEVEDGRRPGESTVSKGTVRKWVNRALELRGVELRVQVDILRGKQLGEIGQLKQVARAIAIGSRCTVCQGEKTIAVDKLDPSLGQQTCPKCDGSGRNENEQVRLQAVNTYRQLLEREAKLFGADAPERHEHDHTGSVALDVQGLDEVGLEAELKGFLPSPDETPPPDAVLADGDVEELSDLAVGDADAGAADTEGWDGIGAGAGAGDSEA